MIIAEGKVCELKLFPSLFHESLELHFQLMGWL